MADDVLETKNMDLFNKVHILGLMKSHIYETNISLFRLFSLMLNYGKQQLLLYLKNLKCKTCTKSCVFYAKMYISINLGVRIHQGVCGVANMYK